MLTEVEAQYVTDLLKKGYAVEIVRDGDVDIVTPANVRTWKSFELTEREFVAYWQG